MERLKLRKAKKTDITLYFDWVNDPEVRKSALNAEEIKFEEHIKWFMNKLLSSSIMLILEKGDEPIGQIRFDFSEPGLYYLDYTIDPNHRGKGFGKAIISSGLNYLKTNNICGKIIAQVKEENIASNKVFEASDFVLVNSKKDKKGIKEYEFIIE